VRVIDVVRAVAEDPEATASVGPTLGDLVLPAMRAALGPFGRDHPWLQPGDWGYAFQSHFDFVVQDGLGSDHPTHPLFAVEFDGWWAHSDPAVRRRDHSKNRLCAASGLPLVRLDDTFRDRRERLSLMEWLARLWAAHRSEMRGLIAQRDAEAALMTEEELDEAGVWLLGERPDLDVDLVFRLEHPFPPARKVAQRLAERDGFRWPEELGADAPDPKQRRWSVGSWCPPTPDLAPGMVER
jgi:hypothetical protein